LGDTLSYSFQLKIAVSGDYAFIARTNGGFYVANITDSTNPVMIGGYDIAESNAKDVAVDGTIVFNAYGPHGVHIVNITVHPEAIQPNVVTWELLGNYYDDSGVANGILYDEDYIYVADGDDGLEILEYAFDSDEDGLSDDEENSLGDDGFITDPNDADSDDDGYTDKEEFDAGTDPTDPEDYPTEAAGISTMMILIIGTFSLFGLLLVTNKRRN
jgi:hypothetical protein